MGKLIEGVWCDSDQVTGVTEGRFVRVDSAFHCGVSKQDGPYPAEMKRYYLYVNTACPWSHRTLIMRALKGLQAHVPVIYVLGSDNGLGWVLQGHSGPQYLYEVYQRSEPSYTGPVSVPVLWDSKTNRIVSNESSEIIRMLNSEFDDLGAISGDYYPKALRSEIDTLNARIYKYVNNGPYRAGFATIQSAYEEAVFPLFGTLDFLEERLQGRSWLVGGTITDADIRLFPTLLRFDLVYYGLFKCNLRRLESYPNLWALTRRLYALPGVVDTIDMQQIKQQYYAIHRTVNPSGIIPVGPNIVFG